MGQNTKTKEKERKIYIEQCKGVTVKDIIKIKLHMWDLKKNYKKEGEQLLYPLYEIEEDTKEHVLRCGRDTADKKQRKIKNNTTEEEWEEVSRYIEKLKEKEKKEEKV